MPFDPTTITDHLHEKIKDMLEAHLEKQPFSIRCYACGASLVVVERDVDSELDLLITAHPCPVCSGGI